MEAGERLACPVADEVFPEGARVGVVTTEPLGGMAGLQLQGFTFARSSTVATDTDFDGFPDGRDMSRLSAEFDWRRDWVLPSGLIVAALADIRGDVYGVQDDSIFDGRILRGHGSGGVELRYPLIKREAATGARQVLEPVMQVMVSPTTPATVPNEDSPVTDFDEGNLFSFSHFPGVDRLEAGPCRVAVGRSRSRRIAGRCRIRQPRASARGRCVGRLARAHSDS
jgi:LPS-assembly protein